MSGLTSWIYSQQDEHEQRATYQILAGTVKGRNRLIMGGFKDEKYSDDVVKSTSRVLKEDTFRGCL